MADDSGHEWVINTFVAHPLRVEIQVKVDMPRELDGRIRMGTVGMLGDVGMTPVQARALAYSLLTAAGISEEPAAEEAAEDEDADDEDGLLCEVTDGVWFATSR